MKMDEMILVIDNQKGTEKNALMNVEDFIKYAQIRQMDSKMEIAKTMADLGRTLGNPESWSEICFAANKTLSARYCTGIRQLEIFLQGEFNDDPNHSFNEEISTWECLKYLEVIGLSPEGGRAHMTYDYEKLENHFLEGTVVHNFNGRDYRILEKFAERKLLLMDVDSGAMVVAVNADMFKRTPRFGVPSEDRAMIGMEWGHGIYLPSRPSLIDFRALRQEYGEPRKMETLTDYHEQAKEQFHLFYHISKDELATDEMRVAATDAMYEHFNTGRPDRFADNLTEGVYDRNFTAEPEKERAR